MSPHALVTLRDGAEFRAIADLTHPYMSIYAARHGLDVIVLRQPERSELPVYFAKYQVRELLANYEQIVFVDTDILIHAAAHRRQFRARANG